MEEENDNQQQEENEMLEEDNRQEIQKQKSSSIYNLFYFVFKYEKLLSFINEIIWNHIDFTKYIQEKYSFMIDYPTACSVSIHELVTIFNSEIEYNPDNGENKETWIKKYRFLNKFSGDELLGSKFSKLKSSWARIMKEQDRYPEVFDFRFLCHATELPENKIREIMNEKSSRLIFFLPNEKYVESLFITSALQTFAKFQNRVLKELQSDFIRVNYKKPERIGIQNAKKSDILSLGLDLENLARRHCYSGFQFNQETNTKFDMDLIRADLAEELLSSKKLIFFEGDFIESFKFSGGFREVANSVKRISQKVSQQPMNRNNYKYLFKVCLEQPEQVFSCFSRKVAQIEAELKTSKKIDGEPLSFENLGSAQDEHEEELVRRRNFGVVNQLNLAKITIQMLRDAYHLVEESLYEHAVDNLKEELKEELSKDTQLRINRAIRKLEDDEQELILKVSKAMLMRQVLGEGSENLLEMTLRDCLQWSDSLEDDQEINSKFLEEVGEEVKMKHLYSFVNVL